MWSGTARQGLPIDLEPIARGDQAEEQGEHHHPEGECCEGQVKSPLRGSRPGKTRSFNDFMRTRLQAVGQRTERLRPGEPQGGDQDQDRR